MKPHDDPVTQTLQRLEETVKWMKVTPPFCTADDYRDKRVREEQLEAEREPDHESTD